MIPKLLKTIFFLPTTVLAFFLSFGRSNNRHLDLADKVRGYSKRLLKPLSDFEEVRIGSVVVADDMMQKLLEGKAPSVKLGDVLSDMYKGRLHKQLGLQAAIGDFIFNGTNNPMQTVDQVFTIAAKHGLITIIDAMQLSDRLQDQMHGIDQDLTACRRGAITYVSDIVAEYRGIKRDDVVLAQCLACIRNNTHHANVALQARLYNLIENDVSDPSTLHESVLTVALQEGVITATEANYVRSRTEARMKSIVAHCK